MAANQILAGSPMHALEGELCRMQLLSRYLEHKCKLVKVNLKLLLLSQDLTGRLRNCNADALQVLRLSDQLHHGLVKVDQKLPCNKG